MIDPDLQNINMILESKLTLIEIDSVSKIKNQNRILKKSLIVVSIAVIAVLVRNYYIKIEDNQKL